jgi:hypothetical protein
LRATSTAIEDLDWHATSELGRAAEANNGLHSLEYVLLDERFDADTWRHCHDRELQAAVSEMLLEKTDECA